MIVALLNKQNMEKAKYISATDFINLIAFTTKEIIEDIVSYLINNNFEEKVTSYYIDNHMRITQDDHNQHFGFDLNTRKFLDDCYASSFFSDYISYNSMNKIKGNFYYLIDEIQSFDFIKELKIDTKLIYESRKAVNQWNKNQENTIYRIDKSDFDNPNYYQSKLIKQDSFSVIDAACLLSGTSTDDVERYKNHPKFTELYADYISYKLMFELALTNNDLTYNHGSIPAIDLQKYLFEAGYIIKGFNDWLTIEPAKPLIDDNSSVQLEASNNKLKEAQEKIADLENQLEQAKAELEDKLAIIDNNKSVYRTPAINIMNEVISEFWIDYDPNYPAPKQSTIVTWITDNFNDISPALALNIDKVCRHSSAKNGGKYKR